MKLGIKRSQKNDNETTGESEFDYSFTKNPVSILSSLVMGGVGVYGVYLTFSDSIGQSELGYQSEAHFIHFVWIAISFGIAIAFLLYHQLIPKTLPDKIFSFSFFTGFGTLLFGSLISLITVSFTMGIADTKREEVRIEMLQEQGYESVDQIKRTERYTAEKDGSEYIIHIVQEEDSSGEKSLSFTPTRLSQGETQPLG